MVLLTFGACGAFFKYWHKQGADTAKVSLLFEFVSGVVSVEA